MYRYRYMYVYISIYIYIYIYREREGEITKTHIVLVEELIAPRGEGEREEQLRHEALKLIVCWFVCMCVKSLSINK